MDETIPTSPTPTRPPAPGARTAHLAREAYVTEHGLLDETGADWRGTPFREGALAVWVVGNNTAVEGEVLAWDRTYVTVKPLRRSYRLVGGVARGNDYATRPQMVDRLKVTVLP